MGVESCEQQLVRVSEVVLNPQLVGRPGGLRLVLWEFAELSYLVELAASLESWVCSVS